jgi:DNA modification methylase
MSDCSVDAVVTDPPYGLAFMGKRWDYDVPSVEIWAECLRVLKPGGHLLAFAGTRTQHRMAVRIEDAGFEVRDMIAWVYGSGFPKSLDVSKAIDKAAGFEREVVGKNPNARESLGTIQICKKNGTGTITAPATPEAQQWAGWGTALKPSLESVTWARKPLPEQRERDRIQANLLKLHCRLWLLSSASAVALSSTSSQNESAEVFATAQWTAADATNTRDALRGQMDTWRYELATTISLNTVSSWLRTLAESWKHGNTSTTETESKTTIDWKTLNCCLSQITPESIIQACSLPGGFSANASTAAQIFNASLASLQSTLTLSAIEPATWRALDDSLGEVVKPNVDPVVMARKPLAGTVAANVLEHGTGALNVDGCRVGAVAGDEPLRWEKPRGGIWSTDSSATAAATVTTAGRWPANLIHDGSDEVVGLFPQSGNGGGGPTVATRQRNKGWCNSSPGQGVAAIDNFGDTGSAARFFYTAKATKAERQGVTHPTVKPLDLMAYLCRLVTPPGGTVLDPFMGSGTTIKAAVSEGFQAIGIERDPAYFAMAEHRMDGAQLGLGLCA